MQRIDGINDVRAAIADARRTGRQVALVPTMGFLHAGHLALIDAARATGAFTVMSLFVNPLQFAPGEDFERYPRDEARDIGLAAAHGTDVLFVPGVDEMYRAGRDVHVAAGAVGDAWEGAVRPGHFDGVLTVVAKLFNIVRPDVAYFGQKDIQQVTLIRAMVQQLNFPIDLRVVGTVREPDGLAMSSRNVYLASGERDAARALSRGLFRADAAWRSGEHNAEALRAVVQREIDAEPLLRADYIAIVDPAQLEPVTVVRAGTIIAIAVRAGSTRLIDNLILSENAD